MRISDWSSDVCSSYLSRKPQHHFLGHFLHRSGKIHLALGQWVLRLARRPAKQPVEGLRGHLQTGAVIEIFLIEPERPVIVPEVDQVIDDRLHVRSEEHTSELQSLMRISYAVFCLNKKKNINNNTTNKIKYQDKTQGTIY